MFLITFSYLQGQVDTVKYEKSSIERKILFPSILGDKPGETEEFRHFFNENLDLSLVANPKLKKGYIIIDVQLDTSGKVKYFMEGTGKNLYDYRTKIAKEFMRVFNLIPQWNPAQVYKDGSWEKMPSAFTIRINIPYKTEKITPKPNEPKDILFLAVRRL